MVQARKSVKNCDTYNTNKERLKNKSGLEIFTGMFDEDRAFLKLEGSMIKPTALIRYILKPKKHLWIDVLLVRETPKAILII